jgi:hypothetical protein
MSGLYWTAVFEFEFLVCPMNHVWMKLDHGLIRPNFSMTMNKIARGYRQSRFNPFTASCENAMTLSVLGAPASCEKFPHSSQLNFSSTESIFNQFSVFLKILNALCVCLQYKHPRSIKRVIRSGKPVTLLLLLWSHKCDFGAEPRSRIIVTLAVKGLTPVTPTLACQTRAL